jgi:RHH-type proline utilization regulon transcriptional repressor/proline dehydrogenase/delta 1-pyrroline-5-carboxylate dehydrogenase
VRCPEEDIGTHLIAHPEVKAIVLTGSRDTARLFARLAPQTPLFAETSGKNAIVVMPDADLDLAAADLVSSAFGYAGQKCSAASLAICVGDVYASARFRRQLVDAARSLVLGPAEDPSVTMPQLIGKPSPDLRRALTQLEPGERWLLQPRLVDAGRNLWSPGIKDGVRPGSWFHRTECFGPVLGLMTAEDLDEALGIQNGTSFGLTGGIHSLDPATVDRWIERVEVGNAYVNRAITGAVVQRQPFGGWKDSVVGPGAKAGGPNYVAQLGTWVDDDLPVRGEPVHAVIAQWVMPVEAKLDPRERDWLGAALRSDMWWRAHHFRNEHDPTGLFCEANVLRYQAIARLVVRAQSDASVVETIRVIAAAYLAGCRVELSTASHDLAELLGAAGRSPARAIQESDADFLARLKAVPADRVRVVGTPTLSRSELPCYLDTRPVIADGGVEGLRCRREQAISRTLHRFGNLIRR